MKQPLTPPARTVIQPDGRFIQANRRTWLHLQPDSTSNFFVWFLLCKQGYECLEFADNAIVDGAYTYNTITAAIYFEVHNNSTLWKSKLQNFYGKITVVFSVGDGEVQQHCGLTQPHTHKESQTQEIMQLELLNAQTLLY
jgi:hypothetical protein